MNNESKLGTVPKGDEGRDAVHVAIVPVRASHGLANGCPVRLNAQNEAESCSIADAIGVVDPFRPKDQREVAAGSWFWLCLYPKTITGLCHVWDHPSFPLVQAPTKSATDDGDKLASKAWLNSYVRRHCYAWEDEPDGGYAEFLRYVKEDRWIFYNGSDCHSLGDVEDAGELFQHLSVVLGIRIDATYFDAFTCSC